VGRSPSERERERGGRGEPVIPRGGGVGVVGEGNKRERERGGRGEAAPAGEFVLLVCREGEVTPRALGGRGGAAAMVGAAVPAAVCRWGLSPRMPAPAPPLVSTLGPPPVSAPGALPV